MQYVPAIGAVVAVVATVAGLTAIAITNPASIGAIIPVLAALLGAVTSAGSAVSTHYLEIRRTADSAGNSNGGN